MVLVLVLLEDSPRHSFSRASRNADSFVFTWRVCVCVCVCTMHPTGKTESGRVMSQFSKVAKLMIIKEKVTQKRLEDEAAAGTAMPLKSFLDTSRAFVNANFEILHQCYLELFFLN